MSVARRILFGNDDELILDAGALKRHGVCKQGYDLICNTTFCHSLICSSKIPFRKTDEAMTVS